MSKEKEQVKAARPSFSLRLQPQEKSLLAEVVQYLNSLGRSDAQRQVESVLVMALLAQARLYDEGHSEEERRRCCIEACDALDKHASMLRQLVGVEIPVRSAAVPSYQVALPVQRTEPVERMMRKVSQSRAQADSEGADEGEEAEGRVPPKSRIESKATAAEANSLFGD